jgi:hypothetical protein
MQIRGFVMELERYAGMRLDVEVEIASAMMNHVEYRLIGARMQHLMIPVIEQAVMLDDEGIMKAAGLMDERGDPMMMVERSQGLHTRPEKLLEQYQEVLADPPVMLFEDLDDTRTYALRFLRRAYAARHFKVSYGTLYCDTAAEFELLYDDPAFKNAARLVLKVINEMV